jgi:hypothetical protein
VLALLLFKTRTHMKDVPREDISLFVLGFTHRGLISVVASFRAFWLSMVAQAATLPRRVITPVEYPSAVPFHGGRSPLTRGPGADVFGIVTTRVVVTMTEPDFRARSGNHIDRDSKFAGGRCLLIFRAGALSKRLLEIASTSYVYCVTLHHRMPLGEASRPVGVWVFVSRRLNGQEPHHRGYERPMPNREGQTAGGFDQAALTGTPTAPG